MLKDKGNNYQPCSFRSLVLVALLLVFTLSSDVASHPMYPTVRSAPPGGVVCLSVSYSLRIGSARTMSLLETLAPPE